MSHWEFLESILPVAVVEHCIQPYLADQAHTRQKHSEVMAQFHECRVKAEKLCFTGHKKMPVDSQRRFWFLEDQRTEVYLREFSKFSQMAEFKGRVKTIQMAGLRSVGQNYRSSPTPD